MKKPQVTIVGGGMITHDQILPSTYEMQRLGLLGEITICADRGRPLKALRKSGVLREAFPDFHLPHFPRLVRRPGPDQLHFDVIMTALRADQHVCTVRPLVLKRQEAMEIGREAICTRPSGGH